MQTYPATSPNSIAVGDVNGDGFLDIAVTDGVGHVGILFGRDGGTFGSEVTYAVGSGPDGVTIGDFNQDGRQDLAVVNQGSNTMSVLLNDGGGTFGSAKSYATAGYAPSAIIAGDLNNDGWPDLAVATFDNISDGGVEVFLNLRDAGAATFATAAYYPSCYSGDSLKAVALADFNQDGWLDMVSVGESGRSCVNLNLRNGTFGSADTWPTSAYVDGVAAGDVNGDGIPDFVAAAGGANSIVVFLGYGDGGFAPRSTFVVGTGGNGTLGNPLNPTWVTLADVNLDGHLDSITTDEATGNVFVALNDGGGAFPTSQQFVTGGNPAQVATGDFNGDGRPDLAVAIPSLNEVAIFLNCP